MVQHNLRVAQVQNSRFNRRVPLLVVALLGAIASVGCNRTGGSPMDRTTQGDHQEHQEHEHFPSHWPEDILRASKRISELLTEPGGATAGSSLQTPAITPSAELADLIGWLPILAADSDLGREDFARIDAWSGAWTDRLRKHAGKSATLEGFSDLDGFRQIARDFEAICQAEQARLDELTRRFSE